MNDDLKERLEKPFPKEMLATLNKGGTKLTYVPVAEVINRLNEVLGVGRWSVHVRNAYRDTINPEWVIAQVQLVFHGFTESGETHDSFYEAFGGQKIKLNKNNEPVDLGDEFKGAVSDGFKKAAQMLGVGLDLARKDEAKSYEPEPESISENEYNELQRAFKALSSEQQEVFKDWCKDKKTGKLGTLPSDRLDEVMEKLNSLLVTTQEEKVYDENDPERPF